MTCNFDPKKCSSNCNKYSMCSFFSVQSQLSEIQSQFNFVYKTLGDIIQSNNDVNIKLDLLEKAFYRISESSDETG